MPHTPTQADPLRLENYPIQIKLIIDGQPLKPVDARNLGASVVFSIVGVVADSHKKDENAPIYQGLASLDLLSRARCLQLYAISLLQTSTGSPNAITRREYPTVTDPCAG